MELTRVASTEEANEWRVSTVALVEKSPGYQAGKASAVHDVCKRIESTTCSLAGLKHSDTRFRQLHQIVEAAAGLTLDLFKSRSLFVVQKPSGTTFDAGTMEDVLQEHGGETLQGKPIQGVIFPGMNKRSNDSGTDYNRAFTISKAQVLVNATEVEKYA